jgi:hypothetical protein
MKTFSSSVSGLFVILVLVSGISINSSQAQRPSGRLVILRAPNFGWNIALNLKIDGRTVANVVQGRSFDRPIPAGRHVLIASPVPSQYSYDPTPITLNVQSGQMYAFMAMWQDQYRVVLRPTLLTQSQLAHLQP